VTTIKKAIIKTYDSGSHEAAIQIAGSLAVWLEAVAVATDIPAGEVIAGRECSVLFFTDDNPDDAVIFTIHGAVPAPTDALAVEVLEDGVTVGTVAPTVTSIEVYEDGTLVGSTP
jgi:hypothetical protein